MSVLNIISKSLSINLPEVTTAITEAPPLDREEAEALLVVAQLVESAACSCAVEVFISSSSKVNKDKINQSLLNQRRKHLSKK